MTPSRSLARLLLLAACTRQEPRPPLRIAVNVWPGYDTLWLADQLGYTAEEGVAVRILTTDGAAAAAREAGFVDVRSEGFRGGIYPWFVYGRKPA